MRRQASKWRPTFRSSLLRSKGKRKESHATAGRKASQSAQKDTPKLTASRQETGPLNASGAANSSTRAPQTPSASARIRSGRTTRLALLVLLTNTFQAELVPAHTDGLAIIPAREPRTKLLAPTCPFAAPMREKRAPNRSLAQTPRTDLPGNHSACLAVFRHPGNVCAVIELKRHLPRIKKSSPATVMVSSIKSTNARSGSLSITRFPIQEPRIITGPIARPRNMLVPGRTAAPR